MKKRSIDIAGHRTSVSLEDDFWSALVSLSQIERRPVNAVIAEVDSKRAPDINLSSAIRLHVLAAARSGQLLRPAPNPVASTPVRDSDAKMSLQA